VILHDNTRLKAELIGRDQKTDLAVLKVKSVKKLKAVGFGNSDKSRVGDWVVAIGNPFGLGGTVTAGIISARGRDINSGPYDDFIQTDASINRGNSGGPMFNLKGEVIGINTAIFSPSGGSVGIGFAIPSSAASPVVKQLIKHGEVKRGWLGVHIQGVTEEIAETLGLKEAAGALVASIIPGGPAEKAKIKPGDVILKFNGKKVSEMRRLPRIVADTEVGKMVAVEVWRNNKMVMLDAKIEELDDAAAKVASSSASPGKAVEKKLEALGLKLSSLTPSLREKYQFDKGAKGVVVTAVEANGLSAEKGIRPGDLIIEINKEEVSSPSQVIDKVKETEKSGRKTVLLLIEGQGGLRFIGIRLPKS
ncbi:MAG: Do family serine endopeptidase, partial [Rhodospirillales bacterium]|nr:Do family serine endopeptidase [Rhodospirillales bacterium]